ncbi:phosphatidylserine decarboxylase proenzyme, mitochondrial-like isoform X4 [Haliotis rufescens]|uniref:phosphatidylserine decarboxylase proenzyme, mitochondrial-like isoform X4 n=1 Tax=Haliotis rufescens TaxID=6454 RepID=UPI00201EA53D|nr:phosphatidylserine decarboxylase proenzyme, mitochondrial-like isoform X4 [Haliotis rufescens]
MFRYISYRLLPPGGACVCSCHTIRQLQPLRTGHVISNKQGRSSTLNIIYANTYSSKSNTVNTAVSKKSRWRRLGLPAGAGLALYGGYRQFFYVEKEEIKLAKNWHVTLYRKMPLKAISRLWGRFNDLHLPVFLRHPLLSIYVWMFGCNLSEAEIEDLKHYRNLGEFFRRQLKSHVRPIDDAHSLTSPADGKILHHGQVKNGVVEQVKGVTYSLRGFLGPAWQRTRHGEDINHLSDKEYQERLGVKPGHRLYHTIIYLAPGDYHRFHSPTQWSIQHRRHFPGELLSVSPGVARWVQGLFNFNERVVYSGTWEHGFFSMTAVGATNVGSIKIYCDEELTTNNSRKQPHGTYFDKSFSNPISFNKGEMFGEFNLGSTIVLIFEAPNDFDFKIENSKKIKFGEAVGTCSPEEADAGKQT